MLSIKRVLFMALVALVAVALYLGLKYNASRATGSMAVVTTLPPARVPVLAVAEAAPSTAPAPQLVGQSAVVQGAASIENVPAPASPAVTPPANAVVGLTAAPQVAGSPDATPLPKKEQALAAPRRTTVAREPAFTARRPPAKSSADNDDAELLAAMLPHLKRHEASPTSAAYERRCGRFTGEAADSCEAKFCNGREGADEACPSSSVR